MDNASTASLILELRNLYAMVGILTIVFSVGGAWFMVKAGIKENGRRIENLERSRVNIYSRLNEQGERIASMEGSLNLIGTNVQHLVDRK